MPPKRHHAVYLSPRTAGPSLQLDRGQEGLVLLSSWVEAGQCEVLGDTVGEAVGRLGVWAFYYINSKGRVL